MPHRQVPSLGSHLSVFGFEIRRGVRSPVSLGGGQKSKREIPPPVSRTLFFLRLCHNHGDVEEHRDTGTPEHNNKTPRQRYICRHGGIPQWKHRHQEQPTVGYGSDVGSCLSQKQAYQGAGCHVSSGQVRLELSSSPGVLGSGDFSVSGGNIIMEENTSAYPDGGHARE